MARAVGDSNMGAVLHQVAPIVSSQYFQRIVMGATLFDLVVVHNDIKWRPGDGAK